MDFKKELPILAIVLLPFLYLAYIWRELPSKVPVHWSIEGEVNRYGDKLELLLIPFLLPLLTYLIFIIVPKIDPKNNLHKMGRKLQAMKFILTTFMSILALFIIYTAKTQSIGNLDYGMLLIGVLFSILGNYFKTIRPNYFIGIKTPWTLESETNWKETHELGGKMWFIGGILIVVFSLILDKSLSFMVMMIITGLITIIPI